MEHTNNNIKLFDNKLDIPIDIYKSFKYILLYQNYQLNKKIDKLINKHI
jgi:hypothetical protein